MQRWPVLRWCTVLLSLSLSLVSGAGLLHAQAGATASKSGGFSFFALGSRGDTDQEGHINNGITYGGDYTHYFHWIVTPSFEMRGKYLPGGTIGQQTYGGGVRLEHRWGRFNPYVGFFVNYGRMTFTHPGTTRTGQPYTHDSSIVYSGGPGLDFDLNPQWSIRGEFTWERWWIGINNGFVPKTFSAGVLYRIPFRPYQKR